MEPSSFVPSLEVFQRLANNMPLTSRVALGVNNGITTIGLWQRCKRFFSVSRGDRRDENTELAKLLRKALKERYAEQVATESTARLFDNPTVLSARRINRILHDVQESQGGSLETDLQETGPKPAVTDEIENRKQDTQQLQGSSLKTDFQETGPKPEESREIEKSEQDSQQESETTAPSEVEQSLPSWKDKSDTEERNQNSNTLKPESLGNRRGFSESEGFNKFKHEVEDNVKRMIENKIKHHFEKVNYEDIETPNGNYKGSSRLRFAKNQAYDWESYEALYLPGTELVLPKNVVFDYVPAKPDTAIQKNKIYLICGKSDNAKGSRNRVFFSPNSSFVVKDLKFTEVDSESNKEEKSLLVFLDVKAEATGKDGDLDPS